MNNVIPFRYESKEVRVIKDEIGNPWWVAKDVCGALSIVDYSQAVEKLDDDERDRYKVPTPRGTQEMLLINESGLYTLILRSNKPKAKSFRRWVTHEVLPSIRKNGYYQFSPDYGITLHNIKTFESGFMDAKNFAETVGYNGDEALLSADNLVKKITGLSCLDLLGIPQLNKNKQERYYTATELSQELNDEYESAREINLMLASLGLQERYRDANGNFRWRPTKKGREYVIIRDTGMCHTSSEPILQMAWKESVIDQLLDAA